jgi:hypothetical protein
MPLTSIIDRAVTLHTAMGVTHVLKAKQAAVELMRNDPSATEEACYFAASKLIHDRTTRAMRAASKHRQSSLWNLHDRYALDVENRVIKDTDRLSRLEWRALLNLRKKQIEDDTAHYREMLHADKELGPIWDEFPDKNFREVETIFLHRRGNGSAGAAAA